jgi:hypothetical protein
MGGAVQGLAGFRLISCLGNQQLQDTTHRLNAVSLTISSSIISFCEAQRRALTIKHQAQRLMNEAQPLASIYDRLAQRH